MKEPEHVPMFAGEVGKDTAEAEGLAAEQASKFLVDNHLPAAPKGGGFAAFGKGGGKGVMNNFGGGGKGDKGNMSH